jgi:hypothetical protein
VLEKASTFLFVDDFCVDNRAFVLPARIARARRLCRVGLRLTGFGFFGGGFVELGRYRLPGFVQFLGCGFDRRNVSAL